MTHYQQMLRAHDQQTSRLMRQQLLLPGADADGAFTQDEGHIDTRHCCFALAHLCVAYLLPQGAYQGSTPVREAVERGVRFLLGHLRPGGCLDLTTCNFASAPDTAFALNALISAWKLLQKDASDAVEWMAPLIIRVIETCSEGVMHGGFHTPNHRWAIAACLKEAARICGRPAFSQRADVYLAEGLDISADGEFAERSAGGYNMVNDDQMIRLFLATGEQRFLEAARSNLMMMRYYLDPDGSVFTGNSTRQDYGTRVYPDGYYILYLLTGYLLKDPALAAMGEACWQAAHSHGVTPGGVEWLALFPEMEAYALQLPADSLCLNHYSKLFAASHIARIRRGDWCCSVMAERSDFLVFQHGENAVSLALYANVCDKRNFVPQNISETEEGFRLESTVDSWYYLPFGEQPSPTSDWWQMDNANTRRTLSAGRFTVVLDITPEENGVCLRLRTEGLSGVPLRLEWAFLPGIRLRNEHFYLDTCPGGSITLRHGVLQAENSREERVTLSPAFARHNVLHRMQGAYPQSGSRFTVFFTDDSPCDRLIHLTAGGPVLG